MPCRKCGDELTGDARFCSRCGCPVSGELAASVAPTAIVAGPSRLTAEDAMVEAVKSRFEDFDKRFQTLEKRFDDIKWYFAGASALFALFISLFTFVANSNFSSERSGLQQFRNDIRADLGKAESLPDLELLGVNGQPLAGQEIAAEVLQNEKKQGGKQISFEYVLRNAGAASSGPMNIKVYANDPIQLSDSSTDEKRFKYETYVNADQFSPNATPGGNYTSAYTLNLALSADVAQGKYPMLIKVYFGKGKVAQARFMVLVKES
jgi:hypothetical protein